ncbi:MAG: AraC family transcriptional regulator [Clostridia bacterium]|nr:AraC family transcriptional regulator [Clostridia bacterium]
MDRHLIMQIPELYFSNFEVENISVTPQTWSVNKNYSGHASSPRPESGFLLASEGTALNYHMPDGRTLTVEDGDMLYLPKGSVYSMTVNRSDDNVWIHDYLINFDLYDKEGRYVLLSETPFIMSNEKQTSVASAVLELSGACHSLRQSPLKIKQLFYTLLEQLLRNTMNKTYEYYPILKAVKYLEKNWNQNVKICELAEMCDMSESNFRKVFSKWAGMGPVEYRNKIRISNAKTMLKQDDESIGDIAFAVGYDDRFYFSRIFKKVTGMTPSDFKKI